MIKKVDDNFFKYPVKLLKKIDGRCQEWVLVVDEASSPSLEEDSETPTITRSSPPLKKHLPPIEDEDLVMKMYGVRRMNSLTVFGSNRTQSLLMN